MKKLTPAQEIHKLQDDLKRLQADFINFRRRSTDERGELIELVKHEVVVQLLPLLDNIERALTQVPKDLRQHPWAQGVNQVSKQAEGVLQNLGVSRIKAVGQPFDPSQHEAVGVEQGAGEQEVVAAELQPGYKMGDRILRPAMVKVRRK